MVRRSDVVARLNHAPAQGRRTGMDTRMLNYFAAASSGKCTVTVWRPSTRPSVMVCLSVRLSRLFSNLNRERGAYST